MTATVQDWYRDYEQLAAVARHMADHGATAHDIAYMLEKPWSYTNASQVPDDTVHTRTLLTTSHVPGRFDS